MNIKMLDTNTRKLEYHLNEALKDVNRTNSGNAMHRMVWIRHSIKQAIEQLENIKDKIKEE